MAKSLNSKLCITFSAFLLFCTKQNAAYSVISFGAKPDGRTDSTQAFRNAWSWACVSDKPETITVPKGSFVVRPTSFNGPCRNRVTISMTGTIIAPSNYRVLAQSNFWFMFYKVNGLSIYGGTFDANGSDFWSCRRHNGQCYNGAQSITFMWSNNIVVNGLTLKDSQKFHMGINNCRSVSLKHMKIRAPSGSPNTDGIHISASSDISIYNSVIKTGDDCISMGTGSRNVMIDRIVCGPGHGISIGSLANSFKEDGVQNITVMNVGFWKTDNGVRIKSWARPSTSFVRDVSFRNIMMYNVYNPIIIDQVYCPNYQCPHETSGVKITNVHYSNIRGTSRSKEAIQFACSPSNPCQGLKLKNIKLTHKGTPAVTTCIHAHGKSSKNVIPRSCF